MLIYIDNRMFYATGIEESKIQQIKNNPLVETSILLGTGDDGGSLRIRGVIEFIEALDVKKRVSDSVPFISRFWSSYDSPKYALLELIPSYIEYMRPGTMDINRIQL
jgi:uncharacterized pyridoxamine 5'-phosphate oxidase family protein